MNKRKVEALIPTAVSVIDNCGIKNPDGTVSKVYRAYISSFGAAVTMGSLKAAIAFFSADTDSTKGDRDRLVCAMYYVLHKADFDRGIRPNAKEITKKLLSVNNKSELNRLKEEYLNASLAIKLALNAFDLKKDKEE